MSFFEERKRLLELSAETDQLEYKKASHSISVGERYEESVLALAFLRCLRGGAQFLLSANDGAGDKFDDVVLCWTSDHSAGLSAVFVQLKHKTAARNTTISKASQLRNTDFSLRKYCDSYAKMRDTLDGGTYALVLYTNIDLDRDAQHMFVSPSPESVAGMKLLDSGGCCYSLNPEDKEVKKAVRRDDQFMQHFYLFCKQSGVRAIRGKIHAELELILGAGETSCKEICGNLCSSLREWMNKQDVCLTANWKSWLQLVDAYVREEVTVCDSVVTRIKCRCVEALRAHIEGCNPAWIRPPGRKATALSATKIHQAVLSERHIVVSVARLSELQQKILCCWGPYCRWLVLVDDSEHSCDALLHLAAEAGPKRRLIVVSYKEGDSAFQDTWKSGDIADESWQELIDVNISLNSEQHLCRLEDVCDVAALKSLLDGKPEAVVALSQLSGPVRMGQDMDPLPGNYITRQLISRTRVTQEFFSALGDRDVCIVDEMSCKFLSSKSVLKNSVKFEELENCLRASDPAWPLFVIANDVDSTAVQTVCSKFTSIVVFVLTYEDDGWEIVFLHRGSAKIRPYVEEQLRSLLKTVHGSRNRTVVEGKPGVGKSTLLVDLASQLKCEDPSWWILRIDLLRYSKVFDTCDGGDEASKDILLRVIHNKKNLGILEHSLLQHCLLGYPRIICIVDGFDEMCPDYGGKCVQALQELAPKRGKLVVTTRPSVTGRLEAALGVVAHSLPPFSEVEVYRFHGWSHSKKGVTDVVRDLLKIPLFSKMYSESVGSAIVIRDIVSLYEAFFERKFRRLYVEKWRDDLSKPGKRKMFQRDRLEHEDQLGLLAVSLLLPRLDVPQAVQLSPMDKDDLLNAGVIYQFADDQPVFIHRTYAEHFLAKWCYSETAGGLRSEVYRTAISDHSLEFFVESFDRMASRGRPLLTAVLNGREGEVQSLLERGADLTEADVWGRNSLHLAAAYSLDSKVRQLLIVLLTRTARLGELSLGSTGGTQEAVKMKVVSEMDETVRSVDEGCVTGSERVVSDSRISEAFRSAVSLDAEGVAGAFVSPQYMKVVGAVAAEDGLLWWTPLRYAAERRSWWAVSALLEAGAQLRHLGDFQRGLHQPDQLWDVLDQDDGYIVLFHHILDRNESPWNSQLIEQQGEKKRILEIEVGVSIACAEMSEEQYEEILFQARRFGDTEVAKLVMLKILDTDVESTSMEPPAIELPEASSGAIQLDEYGQMAFSEGGSGSRTLEQLATAGDGFNIPEAMRLHEAARRGDADCVRQLIEAGADVDVQTSSGKSAAHLAAAAGNADCIKWLLSAGADVDMEDERGRTALHWAAAMDRSQCAQLLIEAGADASIQDCEGLTALHLAAVWGNAGCVRLLACVVESLELTDGAGLTALHYAARNGDRESVAHLLSAGAHSSPVSNIYDTPLHEAAKVGDAECVRLLVDAEADVAARDAMGFTPLHHAVLSGSPDCVGHLLKAGADIQDKDGYGRTPLHCAVKGGSPACVRILLEGGADVHERNKSGDTALHLASESSGADNVRRLLDAGASVTVQNNRGNTPLHCAAAKGRAQNVQLLLDAGADVKQVNGDGDTPLDCALASGNGGTIALLSEYQTPAYT